jgi:hypothetical protein
MSLRQKINLIRDRLPVLYRYNPFARYFLIGLTFLILIYCLYFIVRFTNSDTHYFWEDSSLVYRLHCSGFHVA